MGGRGAHSWLDSVSVSVSGPTSEPAVGVAWVRAALGDGQLPEPAPPPPGHEAEAAGCHPPRLCHQRLMYLGQSLSPPGFHLPRR